MKNLGDDKEMHQKQNVEILTSPSPREQPNDRYRRSQEPDSAHGYILDGILDGYILFNMSPSRTSF